MRSRSRPLLGARLALSMVPMALFIAYVTWANVVWASREVWPLVTFFFIVAALTLTIMTAGVFWRSFEDLPPATGRMIAIVPVYNEDSELVHEVVRSLINQSIVPDEIHVMDDGSATPVQGFDHPLVTWHRQDNAGKREAQANVLRRFSPNRWDFILTVDSDSVCDPDAVEHLLKTMSNPQVQACTGMILVRNWDTNMLTRLIDINVVTSCLMFRMFRSWFGLVTPTSGALALYRAPVVYDNLDDYVTSGTAGDDRRLSFYALMRGQVVGVPEAVVETYLPSTVKGTFMQRMRWAKSAWLGIPFVLTNLRWSVITLYMYPLIFALMWPLVVIVLSKVSLDYNTPVLLYGFAFWLMTSICMTGIYSIYRPNFSFGQRIIQLLLGPVYAIVGLVILRSSAYWALTKLRSTSWHTREVTPVLAPAPVDAVAPAVHPPLPSRWQHGHNRVTSEVEAPTSE